MIQQKNGKTDDLIELIETIQYIENDENSIQDIIAVLCDVLGDKGMRTVIYKGIRSYSRYTKDKNIGSIIHKQFISSQLQNKQTKPNDNNHLTNQVFRISDIACHIFKYLDLKSRLQCKNVNLLWMYNACNPASYYHLNLNDFIRYNYDSYEDSYYEPVYINKKMYIRGEKELTKLIKKSNANVRKLTLCQWPKANAQLFASMQNTLTQLKSIEITMNDEEYIQESDEFIFHEFLDENYATVVSNLLSNNCDTITNIKILDFDSDKMPDTIDDMFKAMKKILFSKMCCLTLDCQLATLPIDISHSLWRNHCNLKMIQFKCVSFDDNFFKNLSQNETLLSNIETLTLHRIKYDEMIPHLLAKMTNIINVDFSCNIPIEKWIDILRKIPQASTIKSLTLGQNSYRRRCKKTKYTWTSIPQDDHHYDFNKLEKLDVKSNDDASLLKGIFDIVFKSNTILNIQQLIVECSANVLVTDLLNIDHSNSKSRKVGLPNLKYIKCDKIRDEQNEEEKDNMIQVMKNISQWLDLLHTAEYHGKNKVQSLDLGSTNDFGLIKQLFSFSNETEENATIDDVDYDRVKNGCKGEKKLCKFAKEFLEQLLDLTKNNNVDCTWSAHKGVRDIYDHKNYNFGVIVEQMKKLNMVSSNDIDCINTMKTCNDYHAYDREFDCYSLFNQKICFQEDYQSLKIVTKSKRGMHMSQ